MISTAKVRRFGWWTVLGLLASWLISCQPAVTPPNATEIEFWTMQLQPQFTSFFQTLIGDYQDQHPQVKVRWVDVPWSAMESKILTAVAAGTAPDVVNLNPNFASQLAARQAWLDLDAQVESSLREQYLPKIWQASSLEGRGFGLPWYLTTQVTIYNRDLLAQAGIEEPPSTYEALAGAAQVIHEKTGKYALFVSFVPGDSGEVLESLVQMGVTLVDGQGRAAFDSPEGRAAFGYWVKLYQAGLLPPEVLTQGHRRAIELYQAGETALLSAGAEFFEAIATNAPSVAEVSAAAPQITGKTGKRNVAVMNLTVSRGSEIADRALDFALFVTSSENQLAFAKAANVLPSTEAALQQYVAELEQLPETTPAEQARKVSALQLREAEVLVPAMKNLNRLQQAIYENLQAAMLGQKSVEQAVADAANQWNQALAS